MSSQGLQQPAGRHASGQDVIALRTRRGWTQVELAKRLGVSPRTVVNWEKADVLSSKATVALGLVIAEETFQGEQPSSSTEQRIVDLEARVDYLERLVLKMRADDLAAQVDEDPKPPTEEDFRNSGGYGLAANRAPRERAFDDQSEGGE